LLVGKEDVKQSIKNL